MGQEMHFKQCIYLSKHSRREMAEAATKQEDAL